MKQKVLAIILAAALILSALPITVSAVEAVAGGVTGDCLWTLTESGELTISGTGAMADYSYDAPWGDKLTKVTIEEGVTNIGSRAFFVCRQLKSISIPESVTTIGEDAVYYAPELESLTIPSKVTTIGDYAFYGCQSVESIYIPASVTSIGSKAFSACSGLKSFVVDENNPVYDSRDNCNALIETATDTLITGTNITAIPDSVLKIGDFAFNVCKGLTELNIPDSVTEIGENAFYTCSDLERVTFDKGLRSIGKQAFYECTSLNNVVLPDGLTEIKSGTFSYCYSLTDITIPDSVKTICGSAFANCRDLTSITIPAGVTSIESGAFYHCNELKTVVIPSNVKSIGDKAFGYYYNNGEKKVEDLVIYGYNNTEAQRYAKDNGFEFKSPSEIPEGGEIPAGTYYLAGSCNGWDHSNDNYLFTSHKADDGAEEYKLTVGLKAGTEFKIISADGTWYPDGMNNNYKVDEAGVYAIYFRPNYDGHSDWFNKVIYASKKAEYDPTEPATEPAAPTVQPATSPAAPATKPATEPAVQPTEPMNKCLLGDADSDGEVSILDATAIQRKLAAFTVDPFDGLAADSDEDGELSILDATAIQRWLVGLPAHAGIGTYI